MSRHIPIVAFFLLMAVVATLADDSKSAPPNSAPAPDSNSDDLPDALTPFAVSPSVAATIAAGPSSNDDDIENDPDAGTDGAPTSSDQYSKLDKKYTGAAASLAPCSTAAAASVVAAAAGYLLF